LIWSTLDTHEVRACDLLPLSDCSIAAGTGSLEEVQLHHFLGGGGHVDAIENDERVIVRTRTNEELPDSTR